MEIRTGCFAGVCALSVLIACGGKVEGTPGSDDADPGDEAQAISPVRGQSLVVRSAVSEVQLRQNAPQSLVILLTNAKDACGELVPSQQGASASNAKAVGISLELPFLAPGTYSFHESSDSNVGAAFYAWGGDCHAPMGTPLADRHAVVTLTTLSPHVTGRLDFLDPEGNAVSVPFDAETCTGATAALLTGACTP
jgi:hypothetical protein